MAEANPPATMPAGTLAVASDSKTKAERNRQAEMESSLNQKVLDTPRTREACRRMGLVLDDLQFRSLDHFYIPGDIKEKQQLRYEHYERRRKERLAQVLAERAKVIAENSKKGEVPGIQSGQFLSMLESLFEKEAKRLETDLKGQLRQHSALVRENEEQLTKEAALQDKLVLRDQRRELVKKHIEEIGDKTRSAVDTRFAHSHELIHKMKTDFVEKQAAFARELLAEEERLARFDEEKRQLSSDKSQIFREKVERMKDKNREMIVERRQEGEQKLLEIEARISAVQQRREEEQRNRMMKSEEQHLHLMDVRETKNRIERVDGYRREELREQIDTNIERIETLLALKDQLLDQRKGRNLKAEATKGSRGISLKRDCLPGPGHYEAPPSCLSELPAPRIGKSKVPGMVDTAIAGTKDNPAPGSYDTSILPNGAQLGVAGGGEFNKRNRDSFLDEVMRIKEHIPAPGRYESHKSSLDSRATKMARDRIASEGIDKFSAKRYPAWARPATETPGPAGYSVDEYQRKEVLRRAQRSLPNLTRDMLRPSKSA